MTNARQDTNPVAPHLVEPVAIADPCALFAVRSGLHATVVAARPPHVRVSCHGAGRAAVDPVGNLQVGLTTGVDIPERRAMGSFVPRALALAPLVDAVAVDVLPREEPHASSLEARALVAAIARGDVPSDDAFDRLLPIASREVSSRFWTPIAVALQAARWLDELAVETVVDVGSGPGKLCVAASLACRCRFIGLEHRPHLVTAARDLARDFGVDDRVTFVCGRLDPAALPAADAYYLFNPFGENVAPDVEHLDDHVELSDTRYANDIAAMVELLRRAPVGTHVLVYNGFGGSMPPGWETTRVDFDRREVLRLWSKVHEPRTRATKPNA